MVSNMVLDVLTGIKAQWDKETEDLIDLIGTGILAKLGHTDVIELDTEEMVSIVEKWKLDRRLVVHPHGTAYRMQIKLRTPVDQSAFDL